MESMLAIIYWLDSMVGLRVIMVLNKLNQLNHCIVLKGYELTQSQEIELTAKIDETNKELEKAGQSILQLAKLLSQAKNLVRNKILG